MSALQADAVMEVEMMSRVEAEDKLSEVGSHVASMRSILLDFDQRLGWKALGYESMKDCMAARFGKTFQTGYRQLLAAKVEMNIRVHSPAGESIAITPIPERHVRGTGIADLQPETQAEAYLNARRMAQAEGRDEPTAAHVEKSVEIIKAREAVFHTPYHVIGHMVTTGEITALEGKEMTEALEGLKSAKIRGDMVQLIAKFGLTCPALIEPLGEMLKRQGTGKPSKTLATILVTGHVAGVPLRQATMSDLRRAKGEAQSEHISESEEARQANAVVVIRQVVVNIDLGDWKRTKRKLKSALGEDGYDWLHKMMIGE
jgi:hypothetical protein